MNKFIKSLLITLAMLPSVTFGAVAVGWNATSTTQGWILPNLLNGVFQIPVANQFIASFFTATSTTATSTLSNLLTTRLMAGTSSGLDLFSNNYTPIAIFGAGGGANATFYGGVNIDGSTRLATSLNGLLTTASGAVTNAVSGIDIKTINSSSIVGSGNLTITGNVATSSAETANNIPFWSSTSATPATLSGGTTNFTWNGTRLFANYASTTSFTATGGAFLATSGGNVGIGTTTAVYPLTIFSATAPQLALSDGAGDPQWTIRSAGGNFYIATTTVAGTATTTTPALNINNSGTVGIGTTTDLATSRLTVDATRAGGGSIVVANYDTTSNVALASLTAVSQNGNANFAATPSQYTAGVGFTHLASAGFLTASIGMTGGLQFGASDPAASIIFYTNSPTVANERMRIMSGGFIGMGTSTASSLSRLTIASTTAPQLSLSAGAGINQWVMRNAGGNFYLATTTVAGTATTSTSALSIISSSGNVGIATTSPWKTFSVVGTMAVNGLTTSTAGNAVCILTNFEVVTAGNTTCVTSSKFTKNDIEDMSFEEAKAIVEKMNSVSFKYKDSGEARFGFIAEEVEKIEPRLVEHAKEDITLDGHLFKKGDPISVDYTGYTAVLNKYIQGMSVPQSTSNTWVWYIVGLLALGFGYQQYQIIKLKK